MAAVCIAADRERRLRVESSQSLRGRLVPLAGPIRPYPLQEVIWRHNRGLDGNDDRPSLQRIE